jgi:large-conductance mechanosensitive channel
MNYQFDAANVNFGDPNSDPSNPVGSRALNIPQIPTQQQPQQKQPNQNYFQKILSILNNKTGTVLTAAMGMATGFAFKDLIASTVSDILQPLIIMILTMTHINNLYNFDSFISPEKTSLNISSFISALVSFIFIIITMYYINILISGPLQS